MLEETMPRISEASHFCRWKQMMLKDQSMKGLHKAGQESRAGGNSRQSLKSAMEMQKAARKKILLV